MIRRAPFPGLVSFGRGLRDEFTKRTRIAIRRRPEKAVLLAGRTDDALRINAGTGPGAVLFGILVLRIDIGETGLDGVQFIASNAPVQDFKPACGRIEFPVFRLYG